MTAYLRLLLIVLVLVVLGAPSAPGAALATPARRRTLMRRKRGQWLTACTGTASSARLAAGAVGVRAVQFARGLLGVPYRYGGDSPSDRVRLLRLRPLRLRAASGSTLPHSSYADFDLGGRVARGALRPGDLVFFDGVGHVGMYVGGGRFIHAPHSGTTSRSRASATRGTARPTTAPGALSSARRPARATGLRALPQAAAASSDAQLT